MKKKKINILGQEYTVIYANKEEKPKLKTMEANGLAELYSKELVINSSMDDGTGRSYNSLNLFAEKVVKHEIIHAFFHEAGLTDYCSDELLIEWLALQINKIHKVFKDVGCVK